MTEPKYPRAWGVFQHGDKLRVAFADRKHAESAAQHARSLNTTIVELIPLPEHESLVAAAVKDATMRERQRIRIHVDREAVSAAVAAERDRCAAIAKQVADDPAGPWDKKPADWLADPGSPPYCCGASDAADEIARRIREVPE